MNRKREVWDGYVVYDLRGLYDTEEAVVLGLERKLKDAIRVARDHSGCVYDKSNLMVFWSDDIKSWDIRDRI